MKIKIGDSAWFLNTIHPLQREYKEYLTCRISIETLESHTLNYRPHGEADVLKTSVLASELFAELLG